MAYEAPKKILGHACNAYIFRSAQTSLNAIPKYETNPRSEDAMSQQLGASGKVFKR
ncbi:unnamed protein product [Dovyalis caffra]|uniref:Uncharacterized protein n=1 Tax=Dovyalis caffra TaxID=77055 RepID=A0AAV1SQA4_9ROSI|nr:unnamed protein product [Dovyalis caffra]